jgi:hypothetical protein
MWYWISDLCTVTMMGSCLCCGHGDDVVIITSTSSVGDRSPLKLLIAAQRSGPAYCITLLLLQSGLSAWVPKRRWWRIWSTFGLAVLRHPFPNYGWENGLAQTHKEELSEVHIFPTTIPRKYLPGQIEGARYTWLISSVLLGPWQPPCSFSDAGRRDKHHAINDHIPVN